MRRRLHPIITLASLVAGCGNEMERAPLAESDCRGSRCAPRPGTGAGAEDSDAGSEPGDAGRGAPVEGVSGRVFVFEDTDFLRVTAFTGRGEIGAPSPGGRVTSTLMDGEFQLDDLFATEPFWVDLVPAIAGDVMPTVLQIDPFAQSTDVTFVPLVLIEDIATNLLVPVDVDPLAGHAIVRFVDGSGNGFEGVEITGHTGAVAAYDVGGGVFRDELEETTASGLAIVLDAPAAPIPGAPVQFAFATPTRTGTFTLQLAEGATTVAAIDISD